MKKYKTSEDKRNKSTEYWHAKPIVWRMWTAAKRRCKLSGVEFTIQIEDIPPAPKFCPIMNLEIRTSETGKAEPYSPSLDRIDNSLGYIPGNVRVISYKANTCKSDLTLQEIENLYLYTKGKI